MCFKLTHPLPEACLVAVSGGVDSMAALHWLSQVPDRLRGIIHVNHNSGEFADLAENLVRIKAEKMGLPLFYRRLKRKPEEGHSPENWWREQRYRFFQEVTYIEPDLHIVLAHNFDDCVEEYVMCTMVRGFQGTIPYAHGNCIRPFRLWKRENILRYALRNNLSWRVDPTNKRDDLFKRAFIRKNIVPQIRELNPGIHRVVEKIIREQDFFNGR